MVISILHVIFSGYLIGSVSPSLIFSKIKHINLEKIGTGNLGATNATASLGRGLGLLVMALDILKGALAYLLGELLFSERLELAGLLCGLFSILGHIFPFYNRFRGGKGLATYGGVILAHSPTVFLVVLPISLLLMLLVNYSFAFPYSAALLVPLIFGIYNARLRSILILIAMSALIVIKHIPNMLSALRGQEGGVRDYISRHIIKSRGGWIK